MASFRFCETDLIHIKPFVVNKSAISPFLGGPYFTHKPVNSYCPCSRALGICKNIGSRTYFGSMTVEFVGVFRHFTFCSLGNRLASFFIVPKNCIFWGASFELIKTWQLCSPKSYKVSFPPIPLLHPTPWEEWQCRTCFRTRSRSVNYERGNEHFHIMFWQPFIHARKRGNREIAAMRWAMV